MRLQVQGRREQPGRRSAPSHFVVGLPELSLQDRFADGTPPTVNGDRILVTKFPYEFADPKRFDVAVFKNPGQAKQNYIKRVVGLPNEEVMIYRGDIYARGKNETKFTIQRKPPEKVLATAQTVYDNDHVLDSIIKLGWPHRWSATQPQGESHRPPPRRPTRRPGKPRPT